MHKINKVFFASVFSALLMFSITACGDDGNASDSDAGVASDGGAEIDAGSFVCDPVGANAEVGALLNAPLEDDVEVIVKEPQHVGDPGPGGLP